MTLSPSIDSLADSARELKSSELTQLSGLLDDERDELRSRWAEIDTARRCQILSMLIELADDNCELDFGAVYDAALADPDAAVREQAVSGLWESGDRRTIPKLTALLSDDVDERVRATAALVLGHFAVLAAAGKLVERDATCVYRSLMDALGNEDEPLAVRRRALEAVAAFATPELPGLIRRAYESDEPKLRQSALCAMGRTGELTWLPAIHTEMRDGDPAMRYEAANAAREVGEKESVSHLAGLVDDTDVEVALAAVLALGMIGGASAKKLLRGISAGDEDASVIEAASETLRLAEMDKEEHSFPKVSDRLG
ncbi:MAG: HEAT repeat domain-containing protein [Chloroflexi bacterium]|nr:HEAT repeat domain-containing protein [Chloroflexota bacterium]